VVNSEVDIHSVLNVYNAEVLQADSQLRADVFASMEKQLTIYREAMDAD